MMANANVDQKVLRRKCDVAQETKEKRILIVEDNEFKYDRLIELLKKYGLTNYVHTETIQASFVECVISDEPNVDIIILDMQFPRDINKSILKYAGVEFIRDIKFEYRRKKWNLPTIIGYSSEDFYEIYERMDEGKIPKEFIGQGKSAEEVVGVLKNFLNL